MTKEEGAQRGSLRENKKVLVRTTVLDVAHRLFKKRGYDNTTIDDICDAAKVSKRTFFRYFPDKEALVFPNREQRLQAFEAFLGAHSDSAKPYETLREATRLFSVEYSSNAEKILHRQQLIHSSSTLQAREAEIDRDWEIALAKAFSRRSRPSRENVLWSAVTAGAVMGVVRATMRHWFTEKCSDDLCQLGLLAIDCLERGFPVSGPAKGRS